MYLQDHKNTNNNKNSTRNIAERGSVLMESLICLPVLLLLMLGVGQFAHIWLCRQVVQYASWSAARATLTASTDSVRGTGGASEESIAAFQAAKRICSLISYTQASGRDELTRSYLPGGMIGGSGGLDYPIKVSGNTVSAGKLAVTITSPDQWSRAVRVNMDVPLLFPFAGHIIGGVYRLWNDDLEYAITEVNIENDTVTQSYKEFSDFFFPHIKLRETALVSKPFVVTTSDNLPDNYSNWGN